MTLNRMLRFPVDPLPPDSRLQIMKAILEKAKLERGELKRPERSEEKHGAR
jgi:hypothetical protein